MTLRGEFRTVRDRLFAFGDAPTEDRHVAVAGALGSLAEALDDEPECCGVAVFVRRMRADWLALDVANAVRLYRVAIGILETLETNARAYRGEDLELGAVLRRKEAAHVA